MTSQRKAMMVNACPRCGDHHWKLHQYNDKQAVYLCDNVECTYPLDSPDLPLLLVHRCARAAALKRILKKKASAVQEAEDLDPSPSTEQTYLTALPRSAQLEAILNKYKRKAESIDLLLTPQETHGKRRRKHCKTSESTHNPSVEVISQAQCRVDEVPQMTTNESTDSEALDVQVLSVKTCRNYMKGNVAHRVTNFGNVSAIKKEVEPRFTPINTKSDSSESRIFSGDVLAAGDVALDKHHFRNSAKTIPCAIDNNSHAVINDVKHLSKSNDTTDAFVTNIKLPVSIDEQSISDSPTEPIILETSKNTHDSNSSAVVDSKSKAISCTTSTTTTTSTVSKAPSASKNVEDNDLKAQHCLLNDTSTTVEPSHVLFADTNVENIIEPSATSSNSANKTSAINSMDSFVPFIEETPSECNDDVIEETVFTIEHSTDSDQPPSDCTIAFTNSTLVLNNDVQKEEKCDSVTEQCIQWQNRDALCWLDVLLCMLAHSVVLRQVVLARIISTANQKKFVKNSSIIKLLESYDDAMDSYFPDSSALDRLSGTSQSSDSYMSMKTGGGGVGTITDLDTGALHDFMNSYDQHVSLVKQQELEKTGKQEAMKILDKIRDEIFCTLQQRRFKCMKGVHNSPVNAMPYLIEKEPRDIQDVFSVQYFSQLKCTNCKRTSNSKKITTAVIPIICNTSTDFDAAAPSFVERCGKCQKHRQLTTYVYKRVPPILTLHFHQGLEYKCLKDLDFTISSVTYRLSAIVVHLAKPDHFFVWIRHSKG